MIETIKLSSNVIKIVSDSNCYIVEDSIVIDTSSNALKKEVMEAIKKFINPNNVKKVIFTHLHYDHIGNADLFPHAEFYASNNAKKDNNFILDPITTSNFNVELQDIEQNLELKKKFNIIKTPGHCKSCIILYYEKDNVLFTGDTYFHEESTGRVDLPTSEPEKMEKSQEIVHELIEKHKPIIAPGHDY